MQYSDVLLKTSGIRKKETVASLICAISRRLELDYSSGKFILFEVEQQFGFQFNTIYGDFLNSSRLFFTIIGHCEILILVIEDENLGYQYK